MLKRSSSHALIVGFLTFLIALSGAAYAATSTTTSSQHSAAVRPKPVSNTIMAYALVTPSCGGCAKLPRNFTPLSRAHSTNVALGSALQKSTPGIWCFLLKGGIKASTATVIASPVKTGGPYTRRFPLESAQWVLDAPDCPPNQIEIRTFGYTIEGSSLIAMPDGEIAFSFVVN
jgi:hypothetical protein